MSSLDGWVDVIAKQGEASRNEQKEREERMTAALPGAIAKLPEHSNSYLLSLFEQFTGGVFWPKENEIRGQYLEAIRSEILTRLEKNG